MSDIYRKINHIAVKLAKPWAPEQYAARTREAVLELLELMSDARVPVLMHMFHGTCHNCQAQVYTSDPLKPHAMCPNCGDYLKQVSHD